MAGFRHVKAGQFCKGFGADDLFLFRRFLHGQDDSGGSGLKEVRGGIIAKEADRTGGTAEPCAMIRRGGFDDCRTLAGKAFQPGDFQVCIRPADTKTPEAGERRAASMAISSIGRPITPPPTETRTSPAPLSSAGGGGEAT